MDYNDIIAQALAQQQSATNAPPPTVPALNTGTPLIDDSTLKATIARALTPSAQTPVPQEDMLSARMKMFTALAQPRMQGQSVAGNVTSALNTGVEAVDAARARAAQENSQRATMASAIASQDTLRRTQEANLQMAAQKFPKEMQQLDIQIKTLQAQGDVAAAAALRAKVMANPEVMAQTIKQEMEGKDAETKLKTAQAGTEKEKAGWYSRGGAPKTSMVPVGDGTYLRQGVAPDGTTVLEHIIPGNPNYTEEMAKKELQKRAKEKAPWYQPGMFLPDPTPQEVAALVAKRKTDIVQKFAPVGATSGTPPTGTGAPTPTGTTAPPVDLSGEVRKIQGKNPDGSSRYSSGKLGVKPGQVTPVTPAKPSQGFVLPPNSHTPDVVPVAMQIARDQQALAVAEQELQDAENGVSNEDPVAIQQNIAFLSDKLRKQGALPPIAVASK